MADSVRRELGLGEQPDRSARDLTIDFLRDRSALLVFDNCEQVSLAVAALTQALLDRCGGVKIVATSLQPLGLPRERVYAVPPLSVSADEGASEAVQLFLDRAREVLPTFETTPDHLALIDTICRRLDGLPLAIELAAARVKVLSLAQIADRLEDALQLLSRGTPAQAARHQTLRAVMQWSYHFLSAAEQTLLRRLSVFAGSFSLDMIEAICAEEAESSLDVLSDLVEKSLVVVWHPVEDRRARYHLLETVRQYAQQQLEAASEAERLHDQLLYWATAIAEQTEPELVGPRQRAWLQRLTADYANLRSALQFAQQQNLFERGLRLATALGRYWWSRGEFTEGLNWLAMFLASAADMPPAATRAKACQYAAAFLYRQGRLDRAVHFAEESLALRRPLNDDRDIAESLNLLGMIASDASEYAQAEAYYREALRLREAIGEARGTAVVLCNLGYVLRLQGQYDRAHEYYEQSLAYYRQSGDVRGIATVLINLGNIHITRGDLTGARPPFEESLALSQQLGDRWGVVRGTSSLAVLALNLGEYDQAATLLQQTLTLAQAVHDEVSVASTLLNLGLLAYLQNDYGRAAACAEEALTRWQAMQHQWGEGQALTLLGRLACDQGDVQRAVQLLRNALTLYQTLDHKEGLADTLEGLAAVAARQQHYVIAVRRLAVAARLRELGQVPLLPPQRAMIDRLLTAARTALGSAAFDRARTTGAALDDQAAIAEVLDETAPSALLEITPEPELRIFALGPARVLVHNRALTSADWTYTKAKELLFYFIAQPPATKAQIGLDIWPDASADQLRNIFHRALHHLRKALGQPDWIVFADDTYSFNRSLNYWCDLHEFEALLGSIGSITNLKPADRSAAIQRLESAVQLWRGDFVEDLDAGEWAIFQREELRQRYVPALIDLGALHFANAHYDRAVAVYRRLLALDAYLELAHRELMRCLVRQGEVGHALQHYQHLREMLKRELQAEPSPETVMVYERITRGDEV